MEAAEKLAVHAPAVVGFGSFFRWGWVTLACARESRQRRITPSLPLLRTFGWAHCLPCDDEHCRLAVTQCHQTLDIRGRAGH